MANGPFESYAPPGVYTRTQAQQDGSGPPTGNRIPVLVGTGKETLSQTDFELVRGSSATADQRIVNEDVSERFVVDNTNPDNPLLGAVDGASAKFRVNNYPLVTGNGQGLTTNDPNDLTVTVDGDLVSPAAVDGERGVVTLQVPPEQGSEVRVTYYFNRTDTKTTDNVSEQISSNQAVLFASQAETYQIVSGTNDRFNFRVNGTEYNVILPAGGRTATDLASEINSVVGMTVAQSDVDNKGDVRLELFALGSLEILDGSANTVLGFSAGQKTRRNRVFHTYNGPIVTGANGGVTTTDPSDVVVKVNGQQVIPVEVDGGNRSVTLSEPPQLGSSVEITYHYNTYQDTFDHLPNTGIRSVGRVGVSPGRNDFVQGLDYVLDSSGRILWGSAITTESGVHTSGTEFFDDTQISTSLFDDKMYFEEVDRFLDNTLTPPRKSDRVVVLGNVPTKGDGRDIPTSDVNLVTIHHGPNFSAAMAAGPTEVTKVDPDTRRVTVKDPIPVNHKVYATYWYSLLRDDTYTLKVTQAGKVRVASDLRGANLYNVKFGTPPDSDTIEWPSGVESKPDAFIVGANGVNETVTVTFNTIDSEPASLTNTQAGPYDIFANYSDTWHITLDDGVSGVSMSGSLGTSAFAVLVSDPVSAISFPSTYEFDFQLDGTSYSVDLTQAASTSLDDVVEVIWRAVESEAELKGTASETFDLSSSLAYDVTIDGVNYAGSLPVATATESAADVVAAWATELTNTHALSVGSLTDLTNDVNLVANSDGTVSIIAPETILVNDSGGGSDLEDILALPIGSTQENTKIARTWEGVDADYVLLRSRTTPATASDVSSVRVLDGNANSDLGFTSFDEAHGAVSAVNKGATLLSDSISSADISNLNSNSYSFVVMVDGVEYTVDAADFSSVSSVGDIQTAIDNEIGSGGANVVASVTVENTDQIRITSNNVDSDSSLEIGNGLANPHIGFEQGDEAGQRKATAAEIAAVWNAEGPGWADNSAGSVDLKAATGIGEFVYYAHAKAVNEPGAGDFLNITTFEFGSDTNIWINAGADNFTNDTGVGFIAGGSFAVGADGQDGFAVTSNKGTTGSSGTGLVGQTYTDDTTGLRFTVLPPSGGDYADTESFTLVVQEQHDVGAAQVNRSLPGVEMYISDVNDVGVGDTAVVKTYDKGGEEPDIGDFYYISYDYEKSDYQTRLFTRFRDIQANFGGLSPENPLTLGSWLALLNGAVIIGCKQVLKQSGLNQAAAQSYLDALDELKKPLAGGITPDIIVPLTPDIDVMGAYVRHCEIQSSQRFRQERRAVFGVASGTRPQDAQEIARGLNSERAVLLYPDSAVISLTNEMGEEESFIVDGTYLAAAMAGHLANPAFDVATPLTRQSLVGFRRLNRTLDEVEKNQLATSGVTVLEDRATSLRVRDGLTTRMDNRLTSTPSVTAIRDYVQQQSRATLDKFIGLKFLSGRAQDVELAMTSLLNSLVEKDIIVDFTGVRAEPDPNDPTSLRVQAFYSPVMPIKYIPIVFTIGSSSSI